MGGVDRDCWGCDDSKVQLHGSVATIEITGKDGVKIDASFAYITADEPKRVTLTDTVADTQRNDILAGQVQHQRRVASQTIAVSDRVVAWLVVDLPLKSDTLTKIYRVVKVGAGGGVYRKMERDHTVAEVLRHEGMAVFPGVGIIDVDKSRRLVVADSVVEIVGIDGVDMQPHGDDAVGPMHGRNGGMEGVGQGWEHLAGLGAADRR